MRIHRSLLEQFKHALVWGSSVKRTSRGHTWRGAVLWQNGFSRSSLLFSSLRADAPQKCGKEHVLADEDVVQIVKKIAG
jgi:ribosome-interacting GTPase 1